MTAEIPRIRLDPGMVGPLAHLWGGLLDLCEQVPQAWSLIGGQMVLLHGLEHDRIPPAASADVDVMADVLSTPSSLRRLAAGLEDLGFRPDPPTPSGIRHRYRRGAGAAAIQVDLLAPDHLGSRADLTTTPPGRTVQVPAGRQATQRTEPVDVSLGARTVRLHRPSLLGAIVLKAAAVHIPASSPERHYRDLAFLLSLPANPMVLKAQLSTSDRRALTKADALRDAEHPAWRALADSHARADGHAMLAFLTSADRR